MKILYYSWGEWMKSDVVETLRTLGETVDVFEAEMQDYSRDDAFRQAVEAKLGKGYDAIFTMDYFPLLSDIAKDFKILYVSWLSDCPNITTYAKNITNDCNRIFAFDGNQYRELQAKGVKVRQLPLAVNVSRLNRELGGFSGLSYQHDISFVGSFYQNGYRQLQKIQQMPQEMKGYIDGVVAAQNLIYGYDMVSELFDAKRVQTLNTIAPVDLGPDYEVDPAQIYRDWIRKEVTVAERENMIRDLGLLFSVDVATDQMPEILKDMPNIKNLGYVDYVHTMPKIFRESKINLNFTLRSIQSGLPLRLTDIMGAGGFVITNYQPELPYYFENGNSIVWFESRENLLDQCAFYLHNDTQREKIRENGYNIVKNAFSYERLLGILLQYLKE